MNVARRVLCLTNRLPATAHGAYNFFFLCSDAGEMKCMPEIAPKSCFSCDFRGSGVIFYFLKELKKMYGRGMMSHT